MRLTHSSPLLALTSLVSLGSLASAWKHADGVYPYGENHNAPDTLAMATAWDDNFPQYEGNGPLNVTEVDGVDRRAAKDFYLRIMPLGASITEGYLSTDGCGYRKWLRSQLRWKGWKVNMVGSKQNGAMADSDNEGHPGWVIDTVHGAFTGSKHMMPNLVLINAGTNDCNDPPVDPDHAGVRMKNMTDDILTSIPGVTVIISTLVKSRDHGPCASSISQQYRELVKSYNSPKVSLADIDAVITLDQLRSDGIHPTDEGYKLFASVWWDAISKVEDVIEAPIDTGISDEQNNTCSKVAGTAGDPVKTQNGIGEDDGNYVHSSTARGVISTGIITKGSDPKSITDAIPRHIFFANLVVGDPNSARKDALDDWIRVYHNQAGKNTYFYRQNLGGGKFGDSVEFSVDMNCDAGPQYYFADFNNDGLDDFFCLQAGSAVSVSLNRGGNPPRFESIGQVVPTHSGFEAADVRIADIDGDGRADYCLTQSDGTILCSRNGGTGDKYTWQGFTTQDGLRGVVFDKKKIAPKGISFGDINGDFRTDYLSVGDNGNVETWINSRGWGSGIVPEWRSAGVTHSGQSETGIMGNIKFARIFGSGRLDYIYLKEESDHYDMLVWENKGSGGTRRKADGDYYCDMRGSGSDDYVYINYDGHADSVNANIHNAPNWGHDIGISLNVPGPRSGIHLADWTGDGRCDVLVQDKKTGALTLYENLYSSGKATIEFANRGIVTSGCTQGWGVNPFDKGMRVADLDGDGRADALCLEADGRVTAWLNTRSGVQSVGQVKFSEGWDRANMRFADVENSGRADLIHLDKYSGAATVFKNNGKGSTSGSSFSWTNRGVLYSPIDRGETMHFSNQGGLGRADLVHVLPVTNQAWTYYNTCPGTGGGDDGPIQDPGLPSFKH